MSGRLYLLPTALGEVSWTAYLPPLTRETACRLDCFIVENAKTARAELKRLGHPRPLRDLTIEQLPEPLAAPDIERLLQPLLAGRDVGLMSEAGCPAVADPGALLVRRAHELQISVQPLVGPSSLLLALMASGFDGQRFAFHGYLPVQEPQRTRRIIELENLSARHNQTQLFIETPYRNDALLRSVLAAAKPDTRLCVASDLSLATETVISRRIAEWHATDLPTLNRRPTVFLLLSAN
jgi:16S rRNA (cytidine1402-2'-O)-methyltransferase